MQMYNVDIIYVFGIAVACMPHISDDISGGNGAAFF